MRLIENGGIGEGGGNEDNIAFLKVKFGFESW
jgi:hypothetical protein